MPTSTGFFMESLVFFAHQCFYVTPAGTFEGIPGWRLSRDSIALLQNEAIDGESGQRHGDDTSWHPAGQSSNGVEPSAGADTPGSGDRLSSGSPAETSSSPLHHQFPSPPPSASRNEVDLLRTQLRSESRRVRHLEELLQHRFSDVGNIREVRLTQASTLVVSSC